MHFSTLATVLSAISFIAGVTAENCKPGFFYCGSTLLHRGNYWNDIETELHSHGQFGGELNALFMCGNNGAISYVQMCGSCHDGGWNKNDYC